MATLTDAQREAAIMHATVLEAAAENMQRVAHRANDRDSVLREIDAKHMQTLGSATLILAMAYRRALSGSLDMVP